MERTDIEERDSEIDRQGQRGRDSLQNKLHKKDRQRGEEGGTDNQTGKSSLVMSHLNKS